MRPARTPWFVPALAFLCALSLGMGTALAGGSISYAKKEIQESGGGWHLMMTIVYGGKPNTAHVPVRFTFTPIAIYENYLDDQHGDKPQKRKISLVGQTPLMESVDVDFADTRGKLFDRTRFDFTITRAHNFSAGEYSVTARRGDGATLGTTQTLTLLGDNPVIDRRAISFVAGKKDKDKDKDKAAAANAPAAAGSAESKAAPPPEEGEQGAAAPAATDPAPASSAAPVDDNGDPLAPYRVQPKSGGCGCRVTGEGVGAAGLGGASLALLALFALRRRSTAVARGRTEKAG